MPAPRSHLTTPKPRPACCACKSRGLRNGATIERELICDWIDDQVHHWGTYPSKGVLFNLVDDIRRGAHRE